MSSKNLFVKRHTPLSRRLLMWGVPLLLLALIWTGLKLINSNASNSFWMVPVEPAGTVVVTPNTVTMPTQPFPTPPPQTQTQAQTTAADNTSKQQVKPNPDPAITVNENAALNEAMNRWRQAWSNKNVVSYLSFYGPDFVPPNGMSRQAWEGARHERISSKQKIHVAIESLQLQINNNTATAKFTQVYTDERLRLTDRKTLVWQKLGGRWLIQRETKD
jgi:ketosteroid isomerase-like protein